MPSLSKPPSFNKHVACIAEDAALAGMLSSIVGDDREYVSVLSGPRMGRPDCHNEVVRRCNAIGKVSPKMVLLAGLEHKAVTGITSCLERAAAVVQVCSEDEVLASTEPFRRSGLAGEVRCQLSEVGLGLLLAKRERKLLRVTDSAPPMPKTVSTSADHVVALDDHSGLAQVIAANYAHSIGADLVLIPQQDDALREEVYAEIDAAGADRYGETGKRALSCLRVRHSLLTSALQFGPREFATFITKGIPYGYFYRDAPSTHLFSYPNLGELVNAGIYWATTQPFVAAAVLIDPGDFAPSETPAVSASLQSDGLSVLEVLGDDADVENTRLFFQAFPYDLLFICSHCGEVGGERLTIRVLDSSGTAHTVVVDEVVQFGSTSFGPEPDKEVQIHQLMRPVSIDGIDWHSPAQEVDQAHVLDSLRSIPRERWDVLSREKVERVPHSTAIKLRRGALLLNMQHVIDACVSPIIFNNGCVSFYDAASTLVFAGARSYIGTLTPVDTRKAQSVAEAIFTDPLRAESLPLALADVQERVFRDPEDRSYVHVGCHFTAIRPPPIAADKIVRHRIRTARDRWQSHLDHADAKMAENIKEFIRFLSVFLTSGGNG